MAFGWHEVQAPAPLRHSPTVMDFNVSFAGETSSQAVEALLKDLHSSCTGVMGQEPMTVPWFPRHISDIDQFSTKTLDAGAELESDHPGFNVSSAGAKGCAGHPTPRPMSPCQDKEYRDRRTMIVANAAKYRHGESIPRVQYTAEETATWGTVYSKLRDYTAKYAVPQYNEILPLMEQHCGYAEDNIPQLQDISDFLDSRTGFTLRPVGGLLSARDFLNALAFRVFFSTQYIRHHSVPLYTPEPDICHELMGHAPMFADPDFADFSHEIGLASLGASDEDIKRLATCYWFSVEFGLAKGPPGDGYRAYGAGLLSSFGELEYSCAPYRPAGGRDVFPEYRPWVPDDAAVQEYPITDYQPVYFVADDLTHAKEEMRKFCASLKRSFHPMYHFKDKRVTVDRAIKRGEYTVTMQK